MCLFWLIPNFETNDFDLILTVKKIIFKYFDTTNGSKQDLLMNLEKKKIKFNLFMWILQVFRNIENNLENGKFKNS